MMDDDDADLDFSQERKVDFTKNLNSEAFFFFLTRTHVLWTRKGGVTMTAGATLRVILTTSMVYTLTTASSNGRNFTLWSDAIELTEDNVSCWRCKLHKHRPC